MKTRRVFLGLGAVALLVVGGVSALLYSPDSEAAPGIGWSPSSLSVEVGVGQSTTTQATFTPTTNATNVSVWVVPALVPYVTVSPASFASVQKGRSYQVAVNVAASSTTPLGLYDGTIHLRQGKKTLARPLPISVEVVWPTATTPTGVTFSYPPTFSLHQKLNAVTDTVTINNFHGAYKSGGLIPPGGGDIVVATLPPMSTDFDDFLDSQLAAEDTLESSEPFIVDGHDGYRVVYTVSFSSAFRMRYVDVYVPLPQALHKFSLAYNDGDVNEAALLSAFDAVLLSAQLPQ